MLRSHRRDLLEARDREVAALKLVIESLVEQVEYLRVLMGQPNLTKRVRLPPEMQAPDLVDGFGSYMSEEEEDLRALHQNGHIDELELEQQLAAAGLRGTKLTLA